MLVVGAGLSGATIANLAAKDGLCVTVIDKRCHIGGNVYDEIDEITGIRVSKYGAHLFHTNDEEVWQYINSFGKWTRWDHKVVADVSGLYVPIPVNINTVNALFNQSITNETEMMEWLQIERKELCDRPKNSEEVALQRVGPRMYTILFKDYTEKQWAKSAADLDPSVLDRIPIRLNHDDRYFSDKYQGLPVNGYTSIVENMLSHPNIKVLLKTDWEDVKSQQWEQIIFTGPIDTYFNNSGLAKLEYRSIQFEWNRIRTGGFYQPNSVVNYPNKCLSYTRCVEYKHFLNQKSDWSIIAKETTCDDGDPYYPVPTKSNQELYQRYVELASKETSTHFIGRLANYKYFNMDQAIRNAMDYYRRQIRPIYHVSA